MALCLIDVDRFKQVNDQLRAPGGRRCPGERSRISWERQHPTRIGSAGTNSRSCYRASAEEAAAVVDGSGMLSRRGSTASPEPCTISGGIALLPGHADDVASLKATCGPRALPQQANRQEQSERVRVRHTAREIFLPDLGLQIARGRQAPPRREADRRRGRARLLRRRARHELSPSSSLRPGGSSASATGISDTSTWPVYSHDLGKIGIPDNILRKPGPPNVTPNRR